MLFGAKITVFTDHKNLTYHNLNLQCICCWYNVLEEYSPTFKYIKGPNNVIADAFSRVPIKSSAEGMTTNGPNNKTKTTTSGNVNSFSIEFDDAPLLECFLNHPPIEQIRFPLDYTWIRQNQFEDELLQQTHQLKPIEYPIMDMGNDIQLNC